MKQGGEHYIIKITVSSNINSEGWRIKRAVCNEMLYDVESRFVGLGTIDE